MQEVAQISEFGKIFVFLILGFVFIMLGYAIAKLISPHKPNPEKNSSYECGEDPAGNSRLQFNMRFYVIALIFILFDVEIVFLFPWSTIFADEALLQAIPQWGIFSLVEMFLFVLILLIGLVYIWVKGDLEWVRPEIKIPHVAVNIPRTVYDAINEENYSIKEFQPEQITVTEEKAASTSMRPPFKSAIRKTE